MASIRSRDVVAGAFVLVVPTVASVYSDAVQLWPAWVRHVGFAAWLVAAGLIVVDQVRLNLRSHRSLDAFDSLTAEKRQRLGHQAQQAHTAVCRAFLLPDLWFPRKWNWTVYLLDTGSETLRPLWHHDPNIDDVGAISFRPDQGATGQAWVSEETVVRVGSEVHDETHGLDAKQQRYFADRRSVVATPIWADEEKIGVLAGVCDDEDHHFETERGRSHVAQTAAVLGTVLRGLPWERGSL